MICYYFCNRNSESYIVTVMLYDYVICFLLCIVSSYCLCQNKRLHFTLISIFHSHIKTNELSLYQVCLGMKSALKLFLLSSLNFTRMDHFSLYWCVLNQPPAFLTTFIYLLFCLEVLLLFYGSILSSLFLI